jgi:hypothetical protein
VRQDLLRGFNLVSTRCERRHQFGPGVLAAHRLGYGLSPCIQRDCSSQYELRTSDQFELRDASNVEVCDPFTSSSAANASPSWPCCAAFTCAAYLKAIVRDQPPLALMLPTIPLFMKRHFQSARKPQARLSPKAVTRTHCGWAGMASLLYQSSLPSSTNSNMTGSSTSWHCSLLPRRTVCERTHEGDAGLQIPSIQTTQHT